MSLGIWLAFAAASAVLLAIPGYNFARFQLDGDADRPGELAPTPSQSSERTGKLAPRRASESEDRRRQPAVPQHGGRRLERDTHHTLHRLWKQRVQQPFDHKD